jgi:hypothetical protein
MKREDLKAGMLVEVSEYGRTELCLITYNEHDDLCFSGEYIWNHVHNLNKDKLTYGILKDDCKITKVYSRANNRNAHKLSTEGRKLLWERKEVKEMTIAEIEKELGYPIKVVK